MPKSFDQWMGEQGKPAPPPSSSPKSKLFNDFVARQHEDDVPDGLNYDETDSRFYARCRSCGRRYEWLSEPENYDEDHNYCYGSDKCLP